MNGFLLDTCTISDLIKINNQNLRKYFELNLNNNLAISSITLAELEYGLRKKYSKKLEEALYGILYFLKILEFDHRAATKYGELKFNYEKKGLNLGFFDSLIAAHSLSENRILVTSDKAFSNIDILKIENWNM